MLKQFFILIFTSILLVSCTFLEQKHVKEPIEEIDTIVDFSTVDAFPLFSICEDIPSREKQQFCFQLEMTQRIYASLKEHSLRAREVVNDTVLVNLIVDAKGKTSLSAIRISDETKKILPEFDSILKASISKLPILKPAIKRGMPVTTQFTLPIILKK